jgi:hypothetical protein
MILRGLDLFWIWQGARVALARKDTQNARASKNKKGGVIPQDDAT